MDELSTEAFIELDFSNENAESSEFWPHDGKRQSNGIFLRGCSSDEVGAWSRSKQQRSIGGT